MSDIAHRTTLYPVADHLFKGIDNFKYVAKLAFYAGIRRWDTFIGSCDLANHICLCSAEDVWLDECVIERQQRIKLSCFTLSFFKLSLLQLTVLHYHLHLLCVYLVMSDNIREKDDFIECSSGAFYNLSAKSQPANLPKVQLTTSQLTYRYHDSPDRDIE